MFIRECHCDQYLWTVGLRNRIRQREKLSLVAGTNDSLESPNSSLDGPFGEALELNNPTAEALYILVNESLSMGCPGKGMTLGEVLSVAEAHLIRADS